MNFTSLHLPRRARGLLQAASLLTAAVLLAACGGGSPQQEVAPVEVVAPPGSKRALSAASETKAPSTLTVRAYASLSGGVGALMTVRVDGVELGTREVGSSTPADYRFDAPALQPGSQIDIVYTNNGKAPLTSGQDRNLFVVQLSSGDTALLPHGGNSSIDRGAGDAALDGQDLLTGGGSLFWDSALRLRWPQPNLTDGITVRASAVAADQTAAAMVVRVEGIVVGTTDVASAVPTDFMFKTPPMTVGSKVDVAFVNAGTASDAMRQLNVHYLMRGTTVLRPTGGMRFDPGTGLAAFDGANQQAGLGTLTSNGALRGTWPAENMTDRLTIRASATLAGDVGPTVQVLADGVVLGSAEIRSTTPTDLTLPALPLKPGHRIEVRPTNLNAGDGGSAPVLKLAYAMSGKTVLLADDGRLDAAWPEPNLTDTLTVRARGTASAGIWPHMQVLVDGILVGGVDVASNADADYQFNVPPMSVGRRLDIVYGNDRATPTTTDQDRSLSVAYATTRDTVWRPDSGNAIYDRGLGLLATDGTDTVAGVASMPWDGALRTSWPAPNITGSINVRASATVAGGVGAWMTLWTDGVAVSSVEVRATTPTDYSMPTTPIRPGAQLAVTFSNRASVDGVTRALFIHYLIAGDTVMLPSANGITYADGDLRGDWPAPNLTDALTVRAYANMAADIGAMLQLRINGVTVATREIRNTLPADHVFAVPKINAGDKIDVAYTNDGVAGGVDRNLYVVQVSNTSTAFAPDGTNSLRDQGAGEAAFDGVGAISGGSALPWNGALRLIWPEPNLRDKLTIRASATSAGGVAPSMVVRVDGLVVGMADVSSSDPADYSFVTPTMAAGAKVDVAFANAETVDGVARALNVHYLKSGSTVLLPTATSVRFDLGAGLAAFDYANQSAGLVNLRSNGALRGAWPAPNMTDRLTVRARATLAGNVGPVMEVRQDGVVLGSMELRSTVPVDVVLPSLPIRVGAQIDIAYLNHAVVGNETRNLVVAYAMAGATVLRPTDAGVVFDAGTGGAAFDGANKSTGRGSFGTNGALRAAWPQPNLTDSLNVRARSDLAGGIGARMQVVVDGVVVGTTDVASRVFADYRFAVPPMAAGSKVDIVYTNDGPVAGVDRNLYVAYMTTSNTVVLPTSAGAVYDRGPGAAAFDGQDVVAASGNMYWNGALRATWPVPNITDTVTVRASATTAGDVGAQMILWVDGVAVSVADVRSNTPVDYLMPTTALRPGAKVAVIFSNRGTVGGVERTLNVHYLIAGGTVLSPTTRGTTYTSGDLVGHWPAPNLTDTLTIRAHADPAGGTGALMQLRINDVIVGLKEIRSTTAADYSFAVPKINPGDKIDIAYINDGQAGGADRNLYVLQISGGSSTMLPALGGVRRDSSTTTPFTNSAGTAVSTGALYTNGTLRFVIPESPLPPTDAQFQAARFLQQATFGPRLTDINAVVAKGATAWIDSQLAMPYGPEFTAHIEAKFAMGAAYRSVGGSKYTSNWNGEKFWERAANAPDQLRKRVAFALHQTFVISASDVALWHHARPYAAYLDTLQRNAFGNYRTLLEDIALSPAMGIYLSHMRNQKEDPATGRMPDENFAREIMQLFSIGLYELNGDGSIRSDSAGNPIETYTNDDVMAMAKVFTGWSWAYPDNELTDANFRWGTPESSATNDRRIDLLPMKAYPGQHSTAEKRLFSGKSWGTTIAAGGSAQSDLKVALDTLFNHPNVGPFVGRQLIQRLVNGNPSPAYVARISAVFNNNGKGVRGDLGAVVKAILLDAEARVRDNSTAALKLREPVLRLSHWMRALETRSASGEYMLTWDLDGASQRALSPGSVFGYFRPGYVPPGTSFASAAATAPEFQIENESTAAAWINRAEGLVDTGAGWFGSAADVSADYAALGARAGNGNLVPLLDHLNLVLLSGRMSDNLRQSIFTAMTGVSGSAGAPTAAAARAAVFLILASPEYASQP